MSPKNIAFGVIITGVLLLGGLKVFSVKQDSSLTTATSDAGSMKESISIGIDSWVGYYMLCSKNYRASMRNIGIRTTCVNDNADIETRLKKLKSGELEFAVATIDAYVALGEDFKYPGTIVAVIDESKGGDALVAVEDVVDSIDDLKNNPSLRVALTKDSPSEHLVRALAVHFDVKNFKSRGSWLVPSNGSADALSKLTSNEVDAAVLWEPDVTKALQKKGLKKIIGTEDTEKLIVDVLLVNRAFASKKPEVVNDVIKTYFKSLKFYNDNPDNLLKELAKETGLKTGAVQSMLKGVKWTSLTENAFDWFSTVGNSTNKYFLIEAIESSLHILNETSVTQGNPLPNNDPYAITQSKFIDNAFQELIGSANIGNTTSTKKTNKLRALTESQWNKLRNVGTLKVRKVQFSSSSSILSLETKRQLDKAAQDLSHYPNFRILIKGHTAPQGNEDANKALSFDRADAVLRYLKITHGINANRMLAVGVGSDEPLAKLKGEKSRAYKYRLPRVELVLKSGEI